MTNENPNTHISETPVNNGRFLRYTSILNSSTGKWNVMVEDFVVENETGYFEPNDIGLFQLG